MYFLFSGSDGQPVELPWDAWDHIQERHPNMADSLGDIVLTIEQPEHREPDLRPGRERVFRQSGPDRWIRVVLEFNRDFERVVTAFSQSADPRRKRSR